MRKASIWSSEAQTLRLSDCSVSLRVPIRKASIWSFQAQTLRLVRFLKDSNKKSIHLELPGPDSQTGPFALDFLRNSLILDPWSSRARSPRVCIGFLEKFIDFGPLELRARSARFCIGFLQKFIEFGPLELQSQIGSFLYWIS